MADYPLQYMAAPRVEECVGEKHLETPYREEWGDSYKIDLDTRGPVAHGTMSF